MENQTNQNSVTNGDPSRGNQPQPVLSQYIDQMGEQQRFLQEQISRAEATINRIASKITDLGGSFLEIEVDTQEKKGISGSKELDMNGLEEFNDKLDYQTILNARISNLNNRTDQVLTRINELV